MLSPESHYGPVGPAHYGPIGPALVFYLPDHRQH